MIELKEYINEEEKIQFLEEIRLALSKDYLNEVHLGYKNKKFSIEPVKDKIFVYGDFGTFEFENVEEVFLSFMIEGKPFIERISDIDYD